MMTADGSSGGRVGPMTNSHSNGGGMVGRGNAAGGKRGRGNVGVAVFWVAGAASLFASTLSVQAADTDTGSNELQEIVVTASKRSETLSKAPLAVSALSRDQLTQEGITSAKDLTKEVPNLSLAVNGVGDAVVINLRGIQSSNIFPDGDPAVAVYVDGINIPRTQGLNGDLYDLARVEVLRGPQGTLYGRNATAGSINIVTAPPTQVLAGHVDVSYGAFSDEALHSFVNIPVADTFALRAVFSMHRNDGYFDNEKTVRHNYDRANDVFGRLTGLWNPSQNFSWQLAVADFNSLGTSNPGTATGPNGAPADGLAVFDRPASDNPQPYDHVNTFGVRSRMDGQLNEALSVQYIAGYGRVIYANRQVSLGSPLPYVLGESQADIELSDSLNENYSHEIDLTFDHGGLHNILGGTDFHERNHNIANFTVYNFGIDYDFTIPDTRQESFGFFDQAVYEVRPGVRLIGGVRYSHDAKAKDGEFISYCPPFTPYNGSYAYNPACFVQIPDAERGDWQQPEAVPTLTQLLQAEDRPQRLLLVDLLARIKGRAASQALARRALFDLSDEVREAAVAALRDRLRDDYARLLIDGFRYPVRGVLKLNQPSRIRLRQVSELRRCGVQHRSPGPKRC